MYHQIGQLLPPDLVDGVGEQTWEIPDWCFLPDAWSAAFLRGLRKLQLDGPVWEVGVGSAINIFFLSMWFSQIKMFFSDYDARAAEIAVRNLSGARVPGSRYDVLPGQWDLVANHRRKSPQVGTLLACIPQVALVPGQKLEDGDNEAHYYKPSEYPEAKLHHLGLGLNEALLNRAREQKVLQNGGKIVLNLAGRPGLENLLGMFAVCGFVPRIVHQEVIVQHAGTRLSFFETMERQYGSQFEFFADPAATQPICACHAEERRKAGKPIYHWLYVIEGTMM